MRKKIIIVLTALTLFLVGIKLFVGELAYIPSSSMETALRPGDWVWVNKWDVGPLVPRRFSEIPVVNGLCFFTGFLKKDMNRDWGYRRIKKFQSPDRMSIVVFRKSEPSSPLLVKRCIGMPGDTLQIVDGKLFINSRHVNKVNSCMDEKKGRRIKFPIEKEYEWSSTNYGPIIIPQRGMAVTIDSRLKNSLYGILIKKEQPQTTLKFKNTYIFQDNYYFFLGDNREYSEDSRYFGFISEQNIIGTVQWVAVSHDPHKNHIGGVRFDRCMKKIK